MKRQFSGRLASVLVLFLLLSPLRLSAAESYPANEPPPEPSTTEELGYGFGSVVANVFYMPAKITYAGLGLLTSGFGYLLSAGNGDAATAIMNPAVRGNYVVTPRHLKGEEALIFIGPGNPPPREVLAQPADVPPNF